MKIMVMDDERPALYLLTEMLQSLRPDAEIVAFEDVDDYLAYDKKQDFDVAFLDIEVGRVTGIWLAEEVKKYAQHCNIIFVTSYSQYALEAYHVRPSGYLLKPFTEEDIEQELKNLRTPVEEETERVDQLTVITFGNFMVYNKKREAIHFSRTYSKEILAYLIDRCGMPVTTRDIAEDIFEDHEFGKNRSKMISKLLGYLTQDLADAGFPEVIVHQNRQIQIDRNKVHCDLYDALDGNEMVRKHYHGEYMLDYSWAETGYAASLLENMGVN